MSHGNLVDGNYYYFLIYAKLLPYTISDGESQTPLRFLLRGGGGSVHRINTHGMLADHL